MASHHDVPTSSRTRLLGAARRLFAANGYEQTATSAIAREAGTSESQLMRYFGGKAGLLEAVFDEAWIDVHARVQQAMEVPGTSRERILHVLETLASVLARDPELATLFLFEGRRRRSGTSRARRTDGFLAFADIARGLVRKGQAAREIDPALDAGAIASSILGATEGMIRDRVMARASGGRGFAEREVYRTIDAMLAGFAGTPGRARRARRMTPARPPKHAT